MTAVSSLGRAVVSVVLAVSILGGCNPDRSKSGATAATGDESAQPPAVQFVNQDGQTVSLADLRGKAVLLTFIYTRCPMPTMCPMISQSMAQVQSRLTPDERSQVALVTVTFDPQYDTPEVLRKYGQTYGADFSVWQFWRAPEKDLKPFMDFFGVWAKKEGEIINHNMRSIILSPEGTVYRTFRGSAWNIDEVVATLRSLTAPESESEG